MIDILSPLDVSEPFELGGVASTGLSVSPIVATPGATFTVSLFGLGTAWTPGTPGDPTFSVDVGTINSQVVADANHTSVSFTAPANTGAVTFTDPSTGQTAQLVISAGVSTAWLRLLRK